MMRRVKIPDRLLPPDPDDSETVPGTSMTLRMAALQEEVRHSMLVIAYLVDQRGGEARVPDDALTGDHTRLSVERHVADDGIVLRTRRGT